MLSRKYIIFISILISLLITPSIQAASDLAVKLSGRILLQVEASGEAWYIYPGDQHRYYLGRPADAFTIMQGLGIGISDKDLMKISVGINTYVGDDNDNDGLSNRLEESLGTNPNNADSDNDGYSDKDEVLLNYDPNGNGQIAIDEAFAKKQAGNIFIQTQKQGQAWYVSPINNKRYYLGRPDDAFTLMRELGLGITNENISYLSIGYFNQPDYPSSCVNCTLDGPEAVYMAAASAIMKGETQKALSYFVDDMKYGVKYTLDSLDEEGKFFFGNMMAGAKLTNKTDTRATYTMTIKFNAWQNDHVINVEKQADGIWKLANL